MPAATRNRQSGRTASRRASSSKVSKKKGEESVPSQPSQVEDTTAVIKQSENPLGERPSAQQLQEKSAGDVTHLLDRVAAAPLRAEAFKEATKKGKQPRRKTKSSKGKELDDELAHDDDNEIFREQWEREIAERSSAIATSTEIKHLPHHRPGKTPLRRVEHDLGAPAAQSDESEEDEFEDVLGIGAEDVKGEGSNRHPSPSVPVGEVIEIIDEDGASDEESVSKRGISKEDRLIARTTHQLFTLVLVAVSRELNRVCNDQLLRGCLVSRVFPSADDVDQVLHIYRSNGAELCSRMILHFVHRHFVYSGGSSLSMKDLFRRFSSECGIKSRLLQMCRSPPGDHIGRREDLVVTFVSICRAIGIPVRLCMSLHPAPANAGEYRRALGEVLGIDIAALSICDLEGSVGTSISTIKKRDQRSKEFLGHVCGLVPQSSSIRKKPQLPIDDSVRETWTTIEPPRSGAASGGSSNAAGFSAPELPPELLATPPRQTAAISSTHTSPSVVQLGGTSRSAFFLSDDELLQASQKSTERELELERSAERKAAAVRRENAGKRRRRSAIKMDTDDDGEAESTSKPKKPRSRRAPPVAPPEPSDAPVSTESSNSGVTRSTSASSRPQRKAAQKAQQKQKQHQNLLVDSDAAHSDPNDDGSDFMDDETFELSSLSQTKPEKAKRKSKPLKKSKETDENVEMEKTTKRPKKEQRRAGVSAKRQDTSFASELVWAEVYCSQHRQWMSFDVVSSRIIATATGRSETGKDHKSEAAQSALVSQRLHCIPKELSYVVAWTMRDTLVDVTSRYSLKWSTTAKNRDEKWWEEATAPLSDSMTALESVSFDDMINSESASSFAEALESELIDLSAQRLAEPLPTSLAAFKSHTLYALESQLTRYYAIYPKRPILGTFKGEDVYPRSCVRLLHTKDRWVRDEGREVRKDEVPYKVIDRSLWQKRHRKRKQEAYGDAAGASGTSGALGGTQIISIQEEEPKTELYGFWQTDAFKRKVAKDGMVPVNKYGNVDAFRPELLPIGSVHIDLPYVSQVARKLGVHFGKAVVGFEVRKGRSVPKESGIVVCKEFEEGIRGAYTEFIARMEQRAIERKREKVYKRWRRLVRALIIRDKVRRVYEEAGTSSATTSTTADHVPVGDGGTPTVDDTSRMKASKDALGDEYFDEKEQQWYRIRKNGMKVPFNKL